MPEGRLQRTRDAYDREGPLTLAEFLDGLPRLASPYRTETDHATGHTVRVRLPETFVPYAWNVIEGDH